MFSLFNESITEKNILESIPEGRTIIISDPPYEADTLPFDVFDEIRTSHLILFCKPENQWYVPDEFLYWVKTPLTKNYIKHVGRFVEMILVKRDYDAPFNCLHWSQMIGVYDDKLVDRDRKHPHQKPITLLQRLIRIYTAPGDVVVDPYMGSGSMGVAAARLGRRYVGCEIDEERFSVAEERVTDAFENAFDIDS